MYIYIKMCCSPWITIKDLLMNRSQYFNFVFSSKRDCGNRLTGLFTKLMLAGMLGASEIDSSDRVSPFLKSAVDVFRSTDSRAPGTTVLTNYVDYVSLKIRKGQKYFWTENDLATLEDQTKEFRKFRKKLFGTYHVWGNGLRKKFTLDHIVN